MSIYIGMNALIRQGNQVWHLPINKNTENYKLKI